MDNRGLRARLAARFREVNGDHPMTAADDAYATAWYTGLREVCAAPPAAPAGRAPPEPRQGRARRPKKRAEKNPAGCRSGGGPRDASVKSR